MSSVQAAKFNMIEQQIRPWEVLDNRVLSTLDSLSREDFVPEAYRGLAYADCQIPLGDGVYMLPPTIEGRMLQSLVIEDDDEVLEVGCGCGYVTACLGRLAGRVTSLAASDAIIDTASHNVTACGLTNVTFEKAGLADFDRDQAFDVIAVTASMSALPEALKTALKVGGRLFIVVGDAPVMEALLITRVSVSEWTTQSLFETVLPRLGI